MARLGALVALVALICAFTAAQARAATYTVGTTADNAGTCVPTSTSCSLRQLIDYEDALASTPSPADVIVVPAGSYTLSNGPLVIDQSVAIDGAGARQTNIYQQTTSATSRVFDIQLNAQLGLTPTVTIAGLATFFGAADSSNGFFGGDIRNRGNLTLSGDLIANGNTNSGSGAGISNDGGTMDVTHSLVENNFSDEVEGGGDSGGIQNYGDSTVGSGVLTVDDSTVAGNDAGLGGGIFSWCNGACSNTTTVIDSTIADNDGGDRGTTGGGLLDSEGTMTVQDSIVAGNFVTDAEGTESDTNCGSSSPGTIISLGYNIDSGNDCGFTATGDQPNTDPGFLGGLQDNGGETDTFALTATSPAVDAIPQGTTGCAGSDQRGIQRLQNGFCDMGGYNLFEPEEGRPFTQVLGSVGATSATINWGDDSADSAGKVDPSTGQVTGTHTYALAGDYDGTMSWTNSDGTPQTTPFQFKVAPAPLAVTPVSFSPVAGVQFSGPVATFTDGDPNFGTGNFTAEINWGDDSASAGTITQGASGFTVSGTHTYKNADTFKMSVTVSCADGVEKTATQTITVEPPTPTVTGITPTSGPAIGGTVVTITGTNFTNQSTVAFGSTAASSVKVDSGTQIMATAPAGTGTVDVTVTTTGGTSAKSAADEYAYQPPDISGISPTHGPAVGGTTVTISGVNFSGATAVDFGSTPATSFAFKSDGQITATSPAGTGTVQVTVTTPSGTSNGMQYSYDAPSITGISPTRGPALGGTTVTISGVNFSGVTAVDFGSTPATSFAFKSDGQITATSPAGTGTVQVTVTTPSGTSNGMPTPTTLPASPASVRRMVRRWAGRWSRSAASTSRGSRGSSSAARRPLASRSRATVRSRRPRRQGSGRPASRSRRRAGRATASSTPTTDLRCRPSARRMVRRSVERR